MVAPIVNRPVRWNIWGWT